ncbi:YdcF family protein [Nitrosophilus kaiyonis]|uniref:YdcF family protein n=1 Tax=Nitrosophilus kaiyonis TaxID=2930200 RepID=UPI0024901CAF|nr:YdcF family protein [Nitrosophilus kaiyonis]
MIYYISKLFTYIFLPPGIIIAAFYAAAIYCKRFKKILSIFATILWIISTDYGSSFLLKPLENSSYKETKIKPKYVVVLGGGYTRGDIPTSFGATKRLLKGLAIAKSNKLPLIYSGFEYKYAKKSIDFIRKNFGFDEKIIYERKSKNSFQNGKFCSKILKNREIFLVTSAYHMPRVYKIFSYFGFKIIPVKTDFLTKKEFDKFSFFPKMENLYNSYIALHEYFGLLSLYLRGIF